MGLTNPKRAPKLLELLAHLSSTGDVSEDQVVKVGLMTACRCVSVPPKAARPATLKGEDTCDKRELLSQCLHSSI